MSDLIRIALALIEVSLKMSLVQLEITLVRDQIAENLPKNTSFQFRQLANKFSYKHNFNQANQT